MVCTEVRNPHPSSQHLAYDLALNSTPVNICGMMLIIHPNSRGFYNSSRENRWGHGWREGCQGTAELSLTITLTSTGTCRALGSCSHGSNVASDPHSSSMEAATTVRHWCACRDDRLLLRRTGHLMGPASPPAFRDPELLKGLSCSYGKGYGAWTVPWGIIWANLLITERRTQRFGLRRVSWGAMANYYLSWD